MKKSASEVNALELKDLIEKYIKGGPNLNYALKVTGHPGVGKSAIVKQVAESADYMFIDTRLAFKENVDLGGYPVPDHDLKEMIYYRPKFIPPSEVPAKYKGIVWFLDESNRAHPTVIQTLFQIITEKKCGEHLLPENTSIILAGNLGEDDGTTITDFDDSALDGRLAVFHLKPSADDWLVWAFEEGIHPSIIKYISMYPERLWDEVKINPNPRGWHQVSNAIKYSYSLMSDANLINYLTTNDDTGLEKIIYSLVGNIAGSDFLMQLTAPRQLTSSDIIEGNAEKLEKLKKREIPVEDLLWALNGTIEILKEKAAAASGDLKNNDITMLSNVLKFIGYSRGDITMAYFFLLLRECGIFTLIPEAVKRIDDKETVDFLKSKYSSLLN